MSSSGNSVLSQEEIDALIKKESQAGLSAEERDIFGEIGNIAMGSASTALSTLLDQKVEITTPHLSVERFEKILADYARPCVLVKVKYTEGLEGINLLIINERDAAVISNLMMGGNGEVEDFVLDELRLSALSEAMNQMMGSSATAVSRIIEKNVNISPPEAEYLKLDDAIAHKGDYFAEEMLVETSFQLKIGELVDSSFKLLSPLQFTRKMVAGVLDNENDGLMAKEAGKDRGSGSKNQAGSQDADGNKKAGTSQEAAGNKDAGGSNDVGESKEASSREASGGRGPGESKELSKDKELCEDKGPGQMRKDKGEVEAGRDVREEGSKKGGSRPEQERQEVEVKLAQFPDFSSGKATPLPHNIDLINDVPLQVTVRLGKNQMTIKEILELGEGSIVELDKLAGEAVDLLVNGKLIARGEVVVIDENFGFRVKNIVSQMDRLSSI